MASGVSASLRPPHLAVTGLTKTYGRLIALDDVSLTIRSGEVLGLIGPNGAGKTTLFECLAGVLPTDAGPSASTGEPLTPRERAATPLLPARRHRAVAVADACAGRSTSRSASSADRGSAAPT